MNDYKYVAGVQEGTVLERQVTRAEATAEELERRSSLYGVLVKSLAIAVTIFLIVVLALSTLYCFY